MKNKYKNGGGRLAILYTTTIVFSISLILLIVPSTASGQSMGICDVSSSSTGKGGLVAPFDDPLDLGTDLCPNPLPGQSHSPGCDFEDDDNIIRTNDTGVFDYEYQTSGLVEDIQFVIELDLGLVWDPSLSSACITPPSGVTGDGVNTPSTLTCFIGDKNSVTGNVLFDYNVLGSNPNGAMLGVSNITTTTSNAGTCEQDEDEWPEVIVSAAPRLNTEKRSPQAMGQITHNGVDGLGFRYPIGVLIQDDTGKGNVGHEMVGPDFTLIDNLSQHVPMAELIGCSQSDFTRSGYPFSELGQEGTSTLVNSIRDSGTTVCTQTGMGAPITMTVTGFDGSGTTVPSQSFSGAGLQGDENWVYLQFIEIFVPSQKVIDAGGSFAATNRIDFGDAPVSISDQDNRPDDESDNEVDHTITVAAGSFAKYLRREVNYGANSAGRLPTQTGSKSGDGLLGPNSYFSGYLVSNNNGVVPLAPVMMCDHFDNTTYHLADYVGQPGEAAFMNVRGSRTTLDDQIVTIEYGYKDYGPGQGGIPEQWQAQQDVLCNTEDFSGANDITWQTSTNANGRSPEDFNLIRVVVDSLDIGQRARFMPRFQVKDIPGECGYYMANNASREWGNFDDNEIRYRTYNPLTHSGSLGGNDRIFVTKSVVRVDKETVPNNQVNQIRAGDPVTFELSPTLTSVVPDPGDVAIVTLQDTLPLGLSYQANSANQAGLALPPSVTVLPDGRELLEWQLGPATPGVVIVPIQFTAISQFGLPNGSVLENVTVISSPDDCSPIEERTDRRSIAIDNPLELTILKQVHTPLIEPGMDIEYTVCWANYSSTDFSASDMLDIFPWNGDGRTPPSDYSGNMELLSATMQNGAGARITFSSDTQANIAASWPGVGNTAADGWCTQAEIGPPAADPSCPTDLDAANAMRVVPDDPLPSEDSFCIDFVFATSGNFEGDIYTNNADVKVPELLLPVPSVDVVTEVVQGSIGDRVWKDYNRNGLQDTGEPGLPAVRVYLLDGSGMPINSTLTDANGNYSFAPYSSGTYSVNVDSGTLPGDVVQTYDLDGVLDHEHKFVLGFNEDRDDVDFGYVGQSSLGNQIFEDGVQDGGGYDSDDDTLVEGVSVKLIDPVSGDTLQTVETNSDGEYLFPGICAGRYRVVVCQSNFAPGGPLEGMSNVVDPDGSNDDQSEIEVGEGEDVESEDFGYNATPLSVEYSSISTRTEAGNITIDWNTISEENNSGFEVWLALGEGLFARKGWVEGAGNSSEQNSYSFEIKDVDPGSHRVQLRQIDFDGTISLSKIVETNVELADAFVLRPAYPNPFNPRTTLRFGVREIGPITIKVYDVQGRVVQTLFDGVVEKANHLFKVEVVADNLSSGLYFVRLESAGNLRMQKIILGK